MLQTFVEEVFGSSGVQVLIELSHLLLRGGLRSDFIVALFDDGTPLQEEVQDGVDGGDFLDQDTPVLISKVCHCGMSIELWVRLCGQNMFKHKYSMF